MKYLCLVCSEEKKLDAVPDNECLAYDAALRKSGYCLASEALQPVHTATIVRVRNGKVSDDLAAYRKRIVAAGGKIHVEEQEVPGMGSLCLFTDPEGRIMGLWRQAAKPR